MRLIEIKINYNLVLYTGCQNLLKDIFILCFFFFLPMHSKFETPLYCNSFEPSPLSLVIIKNLNKKKCFFHMD